MFLKGKEGSFSTLKRIGDVIRGSKPIRILLYFDIVVVATILLTFLIQVAR